LETDEKEFYDVFERSQTFFWQRSIPSCLLDEDKESITGGFLTVRLVMGLV
jgi:hypothetical protein